MTIVCATPSEGFELEVPVLVIGAGASGLVAALSAVDSGGDVLVIGGGYTLSKGSRD